MQNLQLKRTHLGEKYTIGTLSVDGQYFCDTLELPITVNGEHNVRCHTCIPPGTYPLQLTWSPSFKRKLPRLSNVPGRDGILIHRGNTPADTSGCILVGEYKSEGLVINSAEKEIRLVNMMKENQTYTITIE